MPLTTKINVTTTKEIEITLPQYWASNCGNFVHKLHKDEKCIQISLFEDWGTGISITFIASCVNFGINEITKEEFDAAFEKALTILKA